MSDKKMSKIIPKSMFPEGLELCEKNAERLIQEADETFTYGFHTAAFILGFTAWEEVGKAFLFLKYWEKDNIPKSLWKKEFMYHVEKIHLEKEVFETSHFREMINLFPRVRELFHVRAREEKDLSRFQVRIEREYSKEVHNLRNSVLFVNYNFTDNKFEIPIEFVNPSQAANMISSAKYALVALREIKGARRL